MRANRVFPTPHRQHLDPFVVFERFFIEATQGFPTHPHRGFEIVSYMLEGEMAHDDSMGNASTARASDAMRITTGNGMRHSEMPADSGACSGLQLWVNLPRAKKDVEPSYQAASGDALPTTREPGATVTTVVGPGSPLLLHTPVTYRDVRVTDSWEWVVDDGWNGFLYVVSGDGRVDSEPLHEAQFLLVDGGGSLTLSTDAELRVAVVGGRPHDEPIRQRGPFVD
jgi:hypothetical protein